MKPAFLVGLTLLIATSSSAIVPEAAVTGAWRGHYFYADGRAPVEFRLNLVTAGESGKFSGTTREPNTFGDPSAAELTAAILGTLSAEGTFSFEKQYDSSGGQTHSVSYQGELAPDFRSAHGTWTIGCSSGTFEIERLAP